MLKKITVLLVILSMIITNNAYAADILWRITHGDEYQTALIVGQIKFRENNDLNVKVLKKLNGKMNKDVVTVKNIQPQEGESYSIGDYIVISVKQTLGAYQQAYGLYKIETYGEDIKLKGSEKGGDLFALEWYVNTGENEFSFDGSDGVNKIYSTKPYGIRTLIYPPDKGEAHVFSASTDSSQNIPHDNSEHPNKNVIFYSVIIVCAILVTLAVIRLYKSRKSS